MDFTICYERNSKQEIYYNFFWEKIRETKYVLLISYEQSGINKSKR